VTAVIDTGLHKVARYDADRGIDSLETERIAADSADQRAGRAGRVAPGVVRRLWDARDRLRPHGEPEIHRIDLSATILDVIAWGGDPRTLEWFERPHDDAMDAALALLTRLGLITESWPGPFGPGHAGAGAANPVRLTPIGEQVQRLPLHPRLARMLVAAGGAREVAQACALLSERHLLPARTASTSSDLLSAIDQWHTMPAHVHRVASEIGRIVSVVSGFPPPPKASARLAEAPFGREGGSRTGQPIGDAQFRRAILAGYPDRVAKRRELGSRNVLLASGAGAVIAPESGVHDGEFLVALDVHARAGADTRVRIASIVDREWLQPTSVELLHRFDKETGSIRAARVERYDAIVLAEHPAAVDPDAAAPLLAEAWARRGPREDDVRLQRRLRFAGRTVDVDEVVRTAARVARTLDDVQLARGLAADVLRELDRDAPDTMPVPSGRHVRLEYDEDGTISASVKLQEVFGLAETPRVGRRREPVKLALLAPNGRPVQVTRDLRSFWDRTYPEVRKELRGRYPKHPWPEDPWTAPPTARAKRKV
jgi:ATP-dependent helicase HrpB